VAKGSNGQIVVRAVKTRQGKDVDVFAFFLFGSDLVRIADISRIARDEGELKGFQRKEIRSHVNSIAAFLDSGPVLFPNAIILALSPEIEFKNSRGTRSSQAGH
jgi:DGQHR domain-containing protein